ncbi:MAG: hypothetical protein R6V62_00065 [Candidatus Fermentibacteraceae bacterium]
MPLLPPPSLMAGADSLQTLLHAACPEQRGLFFAQIGLEASPDEVFLWERADFVEVIVVFGEGTSPDLTEDSTKVFLNGLPLHLLAPKEVSVPQSSPELLFPHKESAS